MTWTVQPGPWDRRIQKDRLLRAAGCGLRGLGTAGGQPTVRKAGCGGCSEANEDMAGGRWGVLQEKVGG